MFVIDIFINFFSAYENDQFKIEDDRKKICFNYITGWFSIDIMAILPFELILESGNKGNNLIRVARIGKLYKLVKITRLIRLLKVIKQKGQVFEKMTSRFKLSEGLERLIFFFGIFLMIGHTMGCIWVFTGDLSSDTPEDNNWIIS